MKLLVVLGIFFLSIAMLEGAEKQLPHHSSLFETLAVQNGGQIPYPVKALTGPPLARGRNYVFVPRGRSLQKDKTSVFHPRIVLTGGARLFFGYAVEENQLEAVSWNPETAENDFWIVRNYALGAKQRIYKPQRALCLVCHQGEGPIWTRNDWAEAATSADDNVEQISQANDGKDVYAGLDLRKGGATAPSNMDGAVREAARVQQAVRAFKTICGEDLECRRLLLLGSFVILNDDELALLQKKLEPNWPVDGFGYVSSSIPNREPKLKPEQGGVAYREVVSYKDLKAFLKSFNLGVDWRVVEVNEKGALKTLLTVKKEKDWGLQYPWSTLWGMKTDEGFDITFAEGISPSNGTQFNEFVKKIPFEPKEGSWADPKFKRPKVGGVVPEDAAKFAAQGAYYYYGLNIGIRDREFLDKNVSANVSTDYRELVKKKEFTALLKKWPPKSGEVMRTVIAALGAKEIPEEYKNAKPVKLEIAVEEKARETSEKLQDDRLALFVKHCAQCHSGEDAVYDIPFDSLEGFASYVSEIDPAERTPYKMLESKSMPPEENASEDLEKDRGEMLKLLKSVEGRKPGSMKAKAKPTKK